MVASTINTVRPYHHNYEIELTVDDQEITTFLKNFVANGKSANTELLSHQMDLRQGQKMAWSVVNSENNMYFDATTYSEVFLLRIE